MASKIYIDKKGYPRYKDTGKLVHRAVAEKMIGGKIGKKRIVHHKDGNKRNFRKSNLTVMSNKEHSRLHAKLRKKNSRGHSGFFSKLRKLFK